MIGSSLFALVVATLALGFGLRARRKNRDATVLSFVAAQGGPVASLDVSSGLGGFWVYPVLRRLERAGKLRSWETPGTPERAGMPRRVYAPCSWQGEVAFVQTRGALTKGEPVYLRYDAVGGEALAALRKRTCPYCLTTGLEDGPRGGLSVNVTCRGCGARFNLLGPNAEAGAQLLNGPARKPPEA